MAVHPYDLIADPDKTTITAPGGISLGYGPGPGLANASFWNRIGSLFSCYRPAVARLTVFSADDLHQPLALRRKSTQWHPNHTKAAYSAPGLRVSEDRYATVSGLHCRLKLRNATKKPRSYVLCFHGVVEQWAFFDYQRTDGRGTTFAAPMVKCSIDPRAREVTITQPHPHHGLPQPVNSIQRVWLELPGVRGAKLASFGFGLDEADLRALWHDHGALSSLRMRLGQVGGRFAPFGEHEDVGAPLVAPSSTAGVKRKTGGTSPAPTKKSRAGAEHGPYQEVVSISHQHPLYYLTCTVELAPGEEREVIVRSDFHTDDECGDLRSEGEKKRRYPRPDLALKKSEREWRAYLSSGVPQLECDDKPLVRYWYYVWYVLRANRTAPGRHITHPFTAPSKYMYWGPWIWDGYFHVLGEMWLKDPGVARDSIRAVLDMQFPNGFIPVCSGANYRMCFHEDVPGYRNPQGGGFASFVESELKGYRELEHPFEAEITSYAYDSGVGAAPSGGPRAGSGPGPYPTKKIKFIHNEKTQTPLISPALREFCEQFEDVAFAKEQLPGIEIFDKWLARRRQDDKERFILWHGDESGWDNATRHYPVPAKPFDVQVHLALHKFSLTRLELLPGEGVSPSRKDEHGFTYRHTVDSLDSYWCKRDRWHYDFAAHGNGQRTGRRRRQIAPSGLFAMLAKTDEQTVTACLNALSHDRVFNTPYPIPTLARCDPDYAPHGWGWNGPAWLQVNYFTIIGLLEARQYDAAFKLWSRTKDLIIRSGKPHSYELYDPETGTGMGCPDYSWQAMVNHLVITEFAGIKAGYLEPHLPPGMDWLHISNLPGFVSEISLRRQRKRMTINVRLRHSRDMRSRQLIEWMLLGGLGDVRRATCNGKELERAHQLPGLEVPALDQMWYLPEGQVMKKHWEIIIECR